MKKLSKVISVLSASAMVMSMLAGCSDASGDVTSTESGDATVTESGASTFKIGGIGPTTGAAAIYGSDVRDAIQIAVDEINEAGGINGYQIEYKFEDDEHNAEKSVNAYNTLKDWGMQMLVGCVTSAPTIAVSEKTYEDNMFMLTPSGTAVNCVQYDNAFRVCFSDPNQGSASAEYIAGNSSLKDSNIAIIYDSSTEYSAGIHDSFVSKASELGLNVVSDTAFTTDSATDFTVQLQTARDADADLIFLPIYYNEASLILTQANTMGYAPTFFGCDGMDGILEVENFDTSLAEGLMLLTPFSATATDDLTVSFVSKFEEMTGHVPNQFGADAYDAVYAIKAVCEAQNITPDMSVSDICEAMKTGMVEVELDNVLTSPTTLSWDASGEPNKDPRAVVITNGVYELCE
ncbi:MAG: amino acid ABC transporter substrate-binding protein [Butyrivibrio sp.]|jgi:branched-chain amino acid transport system substrate-binding protein|nr:amino acid ABC transporter substrate-binding protein [Butyrivibrio sp.]